MTDVVMSQEGSDTLSVKELDVFLPRYQDFHGSGSSNAISTPDDFSSYPHFFKVIKDFPHVPEDEDEVKLEVEGYINELMELDAAATVLPPDQPVPPVNGTMSPSYFDYLPPSQIEYRRFFAPAYTPCPPLSPPTPGGHLCLCLDYSQSQDAIHAQPLLCTRIGLHCYNLEKGTHFERLGLPQVAEQTGVFTLEAVDPVRNYTTCKFETKVWFATVNKDCFHVITTSCRPFPPPSPPPGEEGIQCEFDTLSVDELFKGNMPDWLPDDSKLHYYEMKESEVEQAKDWLHLYAELAFYTTNHTDSILFEYLKPLELGKVTVQTKGLVENVNMLDNAVFFITFKTRRGDVCKGIIRRTRDGIPEHLSLEAKCFM